METLCQRCSEPVLASDRYCAACGLPQLVYIAADFPAPADAIPANGPSGVQLEDALSGRNALEWRPALNASAIVAIPAGLLCLGLGPIGFIAMAASAALAVGIYVRRTRPAAGLSLGAGVRIGIVTGAFVSWLMVSVCGAGLWVSRFVLHRGNEWDAFWTAQIVQPNLQSLAQIGTPDPASVQFAESYRAMLLSAEGRAGVPLFFLAFLSMFLIFFSILGGALGARILAPARRSGV